MGCKLKGIASSTWPLGATIKKTTIHVGAGEGCDIDYQIGNDPPRLILVEPNPVLAAKLRSRTADLSNVEVYELAIIGSEVEEQIATLHEYNWNRVSSLQQIDQFDLLFPGLRLVKSYQVSAINLPELIKQLNICEGQEHALIIDAPAEEIGIIDSLCESDRIEMFSTISVRWSCADLYSRENEHDSVLNRLGEIGFELTVQDNTDPDWPVFVLRKNRWFYELQQLERQLKVLGAHLSYLDRKISVIMRKLDHYEQEGARYSREQAEQARLVAELQQRLEQVTKARDEQDQLAAERLDRNVYLEKQATMTQRQQVLLLDEMYRAKVQVDLMKDELLKDWGV